MAFSQKTYVFCHDVAKDSVSKQPLLFAVDLRDLISPFEGCSPMFVIEQMSLRAYKRDTFERIPAKFAVLNYAKSRVVTNDPSRLSSAWEVELNGKDVRIRAAGTDTDPFCRTPSTHDDDNRQALLNVLAFMMSGGVRASDGARRSLDAMKGCLSSEHFTYACELCKGQCEATVIVTQPGYPSLSLPLCVDGYVCVPERSGSTSPKSQTYRSVISLLRTAYEDNTSLVDRAIQAAFANSGFGRYLERGNGEVELFPNPLINFVVSLYDTLSDQAGNFVAVDKHEPGLKVLVESPAEKVGHVTGSLTLTLLYGQSVLDVYSNVKARHRGTDCPQDLLDMHTAVTRLGCDALLRRFPLDFCSKKRHLTTVDLCNFDND
uniref:Uncharacterized protein n=1 Tax=Oryzias latipes TaxID=8090 RepID=A0A286P9R1_ORYLA|nr:hypothetical protein [Oryzias latipes]